MSINKMDENQSTIKDRLKSLRKAVGLTQEEFAAKIGIRRNSYANYEIGRNKPIDAVMYSICREYGVRESWLRTGEGEMFRGRTDEEKINDWIQSIFSNESQTFQRRFLLMLCELPVEKWEELARYARFLASDSCEHEKTSESLEKIQDFSVLHPCL